MHSGLILESDEIMTVPSNITRTHMLKVIQEIDDYQHLVNPRRRSRGYCIENEGQHFRHFPPKEVIRKANIAANGNELWMFFGGDEANSFCSSRGFDVVSCGGAPH